jgi:RND family efflux transporter MFP subunit
VSNKGAVEGLYFQPGTELFEIADLSSVWALADVPEGQIVNVRLGQSAHLELKAYPGQSFAGSVSFLAPALDPQTRTLRVRIAFSNDSMVLRPGMYGDVELAVDTKSRLTVPAEAVVETGDQQYVFTSLPDGRFVPHRVKIGARTAERAEIVEGLREGETVVTTGNFLLDSESRLRGALSPATTEPAAPADAQAGP